MGKTHRPFFRVCAMDSRSPRDGRVIEELGTYDPMVPETDARAILKGERIAYWIGVGAQPTPKVGTLIKKYGLNGSHLEAQAAAISRLSTRRGAAISKARDAAISREMPTREEPKPAGSAQDSESAPENEEVKTEGGEE
jgi:small subunit ribosomal protein S16